MSLGVIVEMANSTALRDRIAACAAQEGIADPVAWASQRMWEFAAQAGWADSWAYAVQNYNKNQNPETGARDDVITDQTILSAVQALNV